MRVFLFTVLLFFVAICGPTEAVPPASYGTVFNGTFGFFNGIAANPFQVGGTTIVDSSRNASFVGLSATTISPQTILFPDSSAQSTAYPVPNNNWLSFNYAGSEQKLRISTSADGLTWQNILSGPIYSAPSGYAVNDPTAIYWNGEFIFVYLNQLTAPTSTFDLGTCSSLTSSGCVFAQHVPVPIPGATANEVVWSPAPFIDSDNTLHFTVAVSPDCKPTAGNCSGNAQGMNLWEMHPLDPTDPPSMWTFSAPVLITGSNIPTSTGTQAGIFNQLVVKVGSTYNLFYNNGQNSYYNEWASSTSLTTGYATVETGNWAGWQPTPSLPPQGLQMVHIAPNHWRAYADLSAAPGTEAHSDCLSEDWSACTWTAMTALTFNDGLGTGQGTYGLFQGNVPAQFALQTTGAYAVTQSNGVAYVGNLNNGPAANITVPVQIGDNGSNASIWFGANVSKSLKTLFGRADSKTLGSYTNFTGGATWNLGTDPYCLLMGATPRVTGCFDTSGDVFLGGSQTASDGTGSAVTILTSGKLGIGEIVPASALDIGGKFQLGNTYDGGTGWAGTRTGFLMNDGTTEANFQISGGLFLGTVNNQNVNISTNNNARVTILGTNGNVGIGESPAARLDVLGPDTGSTTVLRIVNSASALVLSAKDTGAVSVGGTLTVSGITADTGQTDTTVCQDTTNHQLYSGTGTLGVCLGTSSLRYKHDWKPLADGLDQVLALKPGNYFYKPGHGDNGAHEQYGFLAEDTVSVLPKLTGLDDEGKPNSVDILGMVPVIVRAIQQQQAEIEGKATIPTSQAVQLERQQLEIYGLLIWSMLLTGWLVVVTIRKRN